MWVENSSSTHISPQRRMDTINVNNLKVITSIGVEEFEHAVKREIFIDLVVSFEREDFNDDIATTFDYLPLAEEIQKEAFRTKYALIETLAEDCAERILNHPMVRKVKVTVRKPRPMPNVESAEIQIKRKKK